MHHSFYMWKSCSEPTPYGPHIGWRVVTSVQGGIFADYKQIDTLVLKGKPTKFGYPTSLHIRATRDWAILSKLRFDAIYPSVAIRQDWNSNTYSVFAKIIMIIKLNRMLWVWCWKHFFDSLNYISISIDDVIIMFWLNPNNLYVGDDMPSVWPCKHL